VTARLVDDHDPDDPVEILSVLPEGYHAQFLAEYTAAVEGTLRPKQFRQLQELLRMWRPWAVAYSVLGMFCGGAQVQCHSLPERARDALIERAAPGQHWPRR
jgi:hypothetical protein